MNNTITYKLNGKIYDIPDDKSKDFESQYKDATIAYKVGEKIYDIPVSKKNEFLSEYKDAEYHDDILLTNIEQGQKTKKQKQGGFWDSWVGDAVERLNTGGAQLGAGLFGALDKATSGIEKLGLGTRGGMFKDASDYFKRVAETSRGNSDRYNGKSYSDLWKEGDYAGAIGDIALQGVESLPMSISAAAAAIAGAPVAGLAGIGAITASDKYDQLDAENPDMGEFAKTSNAILTGIAEGLSEMLGAGVSKAWMKTLYKSLGRDKAEQAIKKGVMGQLQKHYKEFGMFYEPVEEGIEEVASQLAENITDKITGADPDKDIADGLKDSFVYGMGGGAYFSAAGAPGFAKRQYDKIKTRKDYNNAKVAFNKEFEGDSKMLGIGNELEAATPEEKVAFLNALEPSNEFSQEQKEALFNLVQSDMAYKSLRTPEAINEEKSERRELVIQTEMMNYDNANSPYIAENGMIQQVFINGDMEHPVCIVKGDVVAEQRENGEMLFDAGKSSKSMYFVDPNGEMQVISPKQISGVANIVSAVDQRAQYEANIRAQLDMQDQIREQQRKQEEEQEIVNGDDVTYMDPDTGKQIKGKVADIMPESEYMSIDTGDGTLSTVPKNTVIKSAIQTTPVETIENGEDANKTSKKADQDEGSLASEYNNMSQPAQNTDIQQPVFPMKGDEIDYKSILDPKMYADALVLEFGEDAGATIDDIIASKQKELSKASKNNDAIKRRRLEKRLNAELSMLVGVRGIISPEQQIEQVESEIEPAQSVQENPPISHATDIQSEQTDTEDAVKPVIPLGENGDPLYHKADINDTLDELLDGSMTIDEVDQFVDVNLSDVKKRLATTDKHVPKVGKDKRKYLANKEAWEAKRVELQKELRYWGEVKEKLQDARMKPGEEAAINLMRNTAPQNGEELAAQMLANGSLKLSQESYKKELGVGMGEARSMFGLFAGKNKGGVSIERAGEMLMLADLENGTNFFDQNDPNAGRNAIIEVLSSARARGDLINYIKNNRKAKAEQERQAEYNEYAAWCEENYHLSPEDYESYEDVIRRQAEAVTSETIEYINGEIADEIQSIKEEQEEIDAILAQNNESNEEVKRNDERGTGGLLEGSDQLLQDEQTLQTGRTGEAETEYTGTDNSIGVTDGTSQEGASGREVRSNNQGNPIGQDGNLIIEDVTNISDITDEDFTSPYRTIGLPAIPKNVSNAIGAGGKRVIIKKNIFEKNRRAHSDVTPAQSREILRSALYDPDLYGQNQKAKRPYNWIVINTKDEAGHNRIVLLEVNDNKDNVEIVHWHYIDERGVEKIRRQAEREDGQLLILPSEATEEVGALSDPTFDLSSTDKDSDLSRNNSELSEKIAAAEANTDTNPTESQKEAGNYKKGHVKIGGYDISIEQPAGSVRSGKDASGKKWSVTMKNTYGYIRGTEGVDGDHIDVFLGQNPESDKVFVVDQVNPDKSFDEHKVMMGFDRLEDARKAYLSNYEEGWQGLGNITEIPLGDFKKWIDSSHRKTKPFADYKIARGVKSAEKTNNQMVNAGNEATASEPSLFFNSNNSIQMQIEWGKGTDHVSVMPVDEKIEKVRNKVGYESNTHDEGITFMERQLAEKGGLTFMGSELTGASRIKSSRDIAFLFKNLESAATENSFLVMIRPDGTYGVYYSSTGGTDATLADLKLLTAAAKEFGAKKVCFVHNHPSGTLRASIPDINIHKRLKKVMFNTGIETMSSIVINLDSGKYLQFDENEGVVKEKGGDPENVITPQIYQFDRSVFYKPSGERVMIRDASDIAKFVSKQKRGITPKLSAIILDHGNNINKYAFLDPAMSQEELVATLSFEVGKHGNNVILTSNAEIDKTTLRFIQNSLSAADINLLDVLEVKQDEDILYNYKSYANEGVMDSNAEYKTSKEKEVKQSNIQAITEEDAGVRFRKTDNGAINSDMDEINQKFNKELQQQIDGSLPKGHIYKLGNPSKDLLSAGIPDLPIELAASRLSGKSMQENHPFDLSEVTNLPKAIQNPMAIFRSATHIGSYVVMTEIEHKGKNFVVAIQTNKTKGKIEINDIRSIHYRTSNAHMANWIEEGLLEYADKRRMPEWFSKQRYNSAEVKKLFGHATKIVESFVNPTLDEGKISSAVEELSETLNTPVHIIKDASEITDENKSLQRQKRGSKGWYDTKTGEVYLVLSSAESVADAQATVLHEVVAHKGLRGLFGDSFDSTMETVFDSLPQETQESLMDDFGDKAIAAEEYCAHMAETMSDPGIIQKICSAIKEALRKIGIDLKMTDGDIMYMLWKSKNRLMESDTAFDVMEKTKADNVVHDNIKEYDTLFRSKKPFDELRMPPEKKVELKGKIQSRTELFQEAYIDRMIAVKKLQDMFEKKTGKPIPDYMNVYLYENTLSSRNTYEQEQFKLKLVDPMVDAVKRLTEKGVAQRDVENYVMAKHGLERNEKMRYDELAESIDAIKDDELRDRLKSEIEDKKFSELSPLSDDAFEDMRQSLSDKDFSGLTTIRKELGKVSVDDFIADMESRYKTEVKDLWSKISAVNDFSLKKSFDSGMINRETYDRIKGMYKNYIPLRGFDEAVAHDVYDYYTDSEIPYNDPIKIAKGRTSRADDPLAYMMSMGNSVIVGGNKNLMKLHLYRLAQSENSDGLSVNRQWYAYVKTDASGKEIWEPSYPEFNEDPELYRKNIEDHEAEMIRLQSEGRAKSRKGKLKIGLKASKKEQEEHQVKVKLNGEEYVVYVHGNPKVAQAINGSNSPERAQNKAFKCLEWANRQMAANFTTRNPAFVFSNLSRDFIWSATTLGVKEGGKYQRRFLRNIPKASRALFNRVKAGEDWKADPSDPVSVMLDEFLRNGARTGYTALYSIDKYKKQIENSLATGKWAKTKRGYNAVLDFMQLPNEWAEDLSRFATYMTSRQEGRSILQSVSNAKEVTVNFNRKGSGVMGNQFFRSFFLFFNAAIQSLNNASTMFIKNKKGTAELLGGFAVAGMIIPTILSLLGDDDDREKYMGLPDYVRKNNLCIPLGFMGMDGFLKIPLPIELRAFYGIGDAVLRSILGYDETSEAVGDVTLGLLDLLPLNPVGGSSVFVPSALQPIVESYFTNEDFTGKPIAKITPFNEYDPEYQKVYRSTSVIPVKLSEYLNMLTGGDEAIRKLETFKTFSGSDLLNPAAIEHLFEAYLGGMFTFLNHSFKTFIGTPVGLNEFSSRNVPILNRFYDTGEVDGTMIKVNEKFYKYLDDMKEAQHAYRKYEELIDNLPSIQSAKYIEKLNKFENSDDWKKAEFISGYYEEIQDLNEEIKESTDKKYVEQLKEEIAVKKKEMVDSLKNGKIPE